MKYRTRTFYTNKQKSEMWDRWQRGESMSSIGRHFNRASSSIFPHLAQFGGIRPAARKRSRFALSLTEREVELCLNLGDALYQAARFSASSVASTPSLNLVPSMTFGNWFLPLRRSHFFDAA